MSKPIVIATDGSCIQQGNFAKGDDTDRPGASGFVARMGDGTIVGKATPYPNGTIGTMEIKGLRMGLEFAAAVAYRTQERITIKCDSQFVVNGFNDWLKGWAAKNYSKKGGLTGADDWRAIDQLKQSLGDRVKVEWVKGHSGDPLNDRVDSVVNGAARSQMPFDDTHLALGAAAQTLRDPAEAIAAFTGDFTEIRAPGSATDSKGPVPFMPVDPKAVAEFVGTSHGSAPKQGGVLAQAQALLSRAAEDPSFAAFIAEGLDLALDQRRLTARYDSQVVADAQALQTILSERGLGR